MEQGGEKELYQELVNLGVQREQFSLQLCERIQIKSPRTKPAMQEVLGKVLVVLGLRGTPSGLQTVMMLPKCLSAPGGG